MLVTLAVVTWYHLTSSASTRRAFTGLSLCCAMAAQLIRGYYQQSWELLIGTSSTFQQPLRANHELWKAAIKNISSNYYTFPSSPGHFILLPHKLIKWSTTSDGSSLLLGMTVNSSKLYLEYFPVTSSHTCSGQKSQQGNFIQAGPLPFYASVHRINDTTLQLHSWTKRYHKESPVPDFWKHINLDRYPSLWRNLQCKGDGTWLWEGLCRGSLLIVHNGLYLKEVSPQVCSAAIMILCEFTGLICKCTIVEHSLSASSYRGKILGAIIAQLILAAAVKDRMGPYPLVIEDCNNNGVILHGNKSSRPVSGSQTQADVLRVMKCLISHQPFAVQFLYVASHLDKVKEWLECSMKEHMNIKVDSLAKKVLIQAHTSGKYFDGNFPSEDFTIITDHKVRDPAKLALEEYWGRIEAKRIFDAIHIVHAHNLDSVWWTGMRLVMESYPKMFRILYPNRSLVGVAPTVRYLSGIQASAILALIVALQKRHQTHDTIST